MPGKKFDFFFTIHSIKEGFACYLFSAVNSIKQEDFVLFWFLNLEGIYNFFGLHGFNDLLLG